MPRDGHFTKRKIKVFLNKSFLLAGPVRKLRFWGEGSCKVLGFLLWLGREKGTRNRELQHSSLLWTERDSHGAGAFQKDSVGDQLRFWLLPPSPGALCVTACGTTPMASRGDQALLFLSPAIHVPTAALDLGWILG